MHMKLLRHGSTKLRVLTEFACAALLRSADLWLLCCLEPCESVLVQVVTALPAVCPSGLMPPRFGREKQHCMVLPVLDFAVVQNSMLTQVEASTCGFQVHQNNSNDCLSGNDCLSEHSSGMQ